MNKRMLIYILVGWGIAWVFPPQRALAVFKRS
jgi:hypothetical protein